MSHIVAKAMLIVRNGEKILLSRGHDAVKKQPFLRPLGGHVEFGERGEEAIRREMREELQCNVRNLKFLSVSENLFTYNGKKGHEIVFMYEGELADETLYQRKRFTFRDGKEEKEAGWYSRDDAESENIPIYPPFAYF